MQYTRRTWMATSGMAVAAGLGLNLGGSRRAAATPNYEVLETNIISRQNDKFHGWPTVTRRANGELLVVCSGGREGHVCPYGQIELIRSSDDGATWSDVEFLYKNERDCRDAGVIETPEGTLLVNFFDSMAWIGVLRDWEAELEEGQEPWAQMQRWQALREQFPEEERDSGVARQWMLRSTDGGATWSDAYQTPLGSPHGPCVLDDGSLLFVGKDWEDEQVIGACRSTDDGLTWDWVADLSVREGDTLGNYHEYHAAQAADGRIVAQIRNHNPNDRHETLQLESEDGGQNWTEPHANGVWGFPSHLMRMSDDRLLMTYGHRRAPMGNQARISEDHGESWSEALLLSDDGRGDLGYPSTVELAPGEFLSVWYEGTPEQHMAQLRQARWRLQG